MKTSLAWQDFRHSNLVSTSAPTQVRNRKLSGYVVGPSLFAFGRAPSQAAGGPRKVFCFAVDFVTRDQEPRGGLCTAGVTLVRPH